MIFGDFFFQMISLYECECVFHAGTHRGKEDIGRKIPWS